MSKGAAMKDKQVRQEKVWRGDLATVYRDPPYAPLLAFIPECHASRNCERALKRGSSVSVDQAGPWCESCTTSNRAEATVRWIDGRWAAA